MKTKSLNASRAFLCCSNIIFLMSGFVLISLGALLLADGERVLLSRLLGPGDTTPEQPLFYYLAFAIVGVGFLMAATGLLGCWVSCLYNHCVTATYVVLIILLLFGECTVCVLAVFWPHLLGVDVRTARLVRALQRSYAVPGREQFTAALDLAQTSTSPIPLRISVDKILLVVDWLKAGHGFASNESPSFSTLEFSCCGINGSSNYGTSWWRLQEVGRRELVVPLSCCTLNNTLQFESFLNPEPKNLTLCQALNPAEHQHARHTQGCIELIEKWTQDQALILLGVGLAVVLVELCALLSTLLECSKLQKRDKPQPSTFTSTQALGPFNETDHDYGIENRMHMAGTTFGAKS